MTRVAAVDLGASSGRVMAGTAGPGRLDVEEIRRFPNGGVQAGPVLYWDVLGLYRETLAGIRYHEPHSKSIVRYFSFVPR